MKLGMEVGQYRAHVALKPLRVRACARCRAKQVKVKLGETGRELNYELWGKPGRIGLFIEVVNTVIYIGK